MCVRPGERWGVEFAGSSDPIIRAGLDRSSAAFTSVPNVDLFGGAVYRTQGNYKDGNGNEIGNTGNQIAAGLLKLTVRPATDTRSSSAAYSRNINTTSASRTAVRSRPRRSAR